MDIQYMPAVLGSASSDRGIWEDLYCVNTNSQIGDLYAGLEEISGVCVAISVETVRYILFEGIRGSPRLEGEYASTALVLADLSKNHNICMVSNEDCVFSELCGRHIGQEKTFCVENDCRIPRYLKLEKKGFRAEDISFLRTSAFLKFLKYHLT